MLTEESKNGFIKTKVRTFEGLNVRYNVKVLHFKDPAI